MMEIEEGSMFEVDISLDNQTLVLVDTKVVEDKKIILVFDLYTLDKIAEFPVNVCNRVFLDYDDYDPMNDAYSPEFATSWKTKYNFPRVHWWNDGKYVWVGVGATPESKIFYEFRTYDTETMRVVGTFQR